LVLTTVEELVQLLVQVGTPSIIAVIVSAFCNYTFDVRRMGKDRRITYLDEALERFYGPMIYYFRLMEGWGKFIGAPNGYPFHPDTLTEYLREMEDCMKKGIRFASPEISDLWYEWQPYAVAAIELRKGGTSYTQFTPEAYKKKTKELSQAIRKEAEELKNLVSTERKWRALPRSEMI